MRCIYGNTVTPADIICIVRQGCILGTLLFLMYLNDLKNAPDVLVTIMFANDISLFYSHCNNKTFFTTVSWDLNRIGQWLNANKLSLNINKTKYTFFHKNSAKEYIPLRLAEPKMAYTKIERKRSI